MRSTALGLVVALALCGATVAGGQGSATPDTTAGTASSTAAPATGSGSVGWQRPTSRHPGRSATVADGSVHVDAVADHRNEGTQYSTTTPPPDDGLGRGLALAAIGLLAGLGLVAATTAGIALVYGRLRSGQFAAWETALFVFVLVGGLFAYVRGITFDPSAEGRYSLAALASLGAFGSLIAWIVLQPAVFGLRRADGEPPAGADEDEHPGLVVSGSFLAVIVSLLIGGVKLLAVVVPVGLLVAYYVVWER